MKVKLAWSDAMILPDGRVVAPGEVVDVPGDWQLSAEQWEPQKTSQKSKTEEDD